MILETERLFRRNWLASDMEHYMTLAHDVGYNCFSRPGHFLVGTAEEARAKIQDRIVLFNERKPGKFPVKGIPRHLRLGTLRSGRASRGRAGLSALPQALGTRIGERSRDCGLAVWLGDLDFERIMPFTLPQNRASIRAPEKLGFRHLRDVLHAELPHLLYELPREMFAS